MVAAHATSGLTYRAWCRREGVNAGTFGWWRRELARRDAARPSRPFVPVHVAEDRIMPGDSQIEIELTDGRRVRVTGRVDRQMLVDVLDVLEQRPC
jgi:transposase-like protein